MTDPKQIAIDKERERSEFESGPEARERELTGLRKPLKFNISEDWCLKMAKAEEGAGDPDCGAGSPANVGAAVCAKCGCETGGEVALVNGKEWCHPCADDADTTSVVGSPTGERT